MVKNPNTLKVNYNTKEIKKTEVKLGIFRPVFTVSLCIFSDIQLNLNFLLRLCLKIFEDIGAHFRQIVDGFDAERA